MIQRVIRAFRRHGLVKFCHLIVYNAAYFAMWPFRTSPEIDDDFDQRYGTDTVRIREIGTLDIASEHARFAVRYQPSSCYLFQEIFEKLHMDVSSFSFIDYGCGKGRVLLLASHYPFKRVIGVEFSQELATIAEQNIRTYRSPEQRCTDLSVVCCDAATYKPPLESLVCYFYNPFAEQIMKRVITTLDESLGALERPAFIIYVDPRHSRVIEGSGAWEPFISNGGYKVFRHRMLEGYRRP